MGFINLGFDSEVEVTKKDGNQNGVAPSNIIVLPGRIYIDKRLFLELRKQVEDIVGQLLHGAEYRIQDLVSKKWWTPLTNSERRTVGRALAHLVSNDQIGLRFVGCPRCNSKRYRLP